MLYRIGIGLHGMQEVTSSSLVFSTSIRDKSEINEDKSRKIKVLRDFRFYFHDIRKTRKSPVQTKSRY